MQDVAQRVDQSCRRCAGGDSCPYRFYDAVTIWQQVDFRLQQVAKSTNAVWNCNEQRAILNLMWHYAEAVYWEEARK